MFLPLLVFFFALASLFAAAEDPVQWTLTVRFEVRRARLARAGQIHRDHSTALARLFDDHAARRSEPDHREHRGQSGRRGIQDLSIQAGAQARSRASASTPKRLPSSMCFCSTSS
jgi:hypothetical protein